MSELTLTLHEKAISLAKQFHQAESMLIDVLSEIDTQRIFVSLGYASLFDYAVKALKLSEANASNFITVARKSRTVPELKMAIDRGEITVSKARKIAPVLTKENHSHWLELAKTLPKPKLEKEVARVLPQAATQERARYVTHSRLELKLGISEETLTKLKRAQDLLSKKTKSAASFEQTLEALLDHFLTRHDPVMKAKRAAERNLELDANQAVQGPQRQDVGAGVTIKQESQRAGASMKQERRQEADAGHGADADYGAGAEAGQTSLGGAHSISDAAASVPGTRSSRDQRTNARSGTEPVDELVSYRPALVSVVRQSVPAARQSVPVIRQSVLAARQPLRSTLKHAVFARDQGQCTFTDITGSRCTNRRWIQIHHIKPVALGGGNELSNLQTLCYNHHRHQHDA